MKNQWLEQNDIRFFKKILMEPMVFPKFEKPKAKVAFAGDAVVIGDIRIDIPFCLNSLTGEQIALLERYNVTVQGLTR